SRRLIRSPRRRVAEKTQARRSPAPSQFSYSERVRTSSVAQRVSQTGSYPVGSYAREWRCAGICRVYRRHTRSDLPLAQIEGLPRLRADDILMPAQQWFWKRKSPAQRQRPPLPGTLRRMRLLLLQVLEPTRQARCESQQSARQVGPAPQKES